MLGKQEINVTDIQLFLKYHNTLTYANVHIPLSFRQVVVTLLPFVLQDGYTALMEACKEGHTDIVKCLIHDGKARADITDHVGIHFLLQCIQLHVIACIFFYLAFVTLLPLSMPLFRFPGNAH